MKVDFILDIQVGPPVADLRSAPQALDSQHGESEIIMNEDLLLVLLGESGIRGGGKIRKWPISDSGSSVTLGGDTACRECDFFGLCIAENRGPNGARRVKDINRGVIAITKFVTDLNFVFWVSVLYGLRTNRSVSYFRDWGSSWAA